MRLAQVKGLDVIAVTDFYSGAFIDRVLQAASDSKLVVVPGVNLRCKVDACDDVVLTCLFAEDFGAQVVNEFLRALAIPAQAQGNSGYVLDLAFESVLTSIEAYGGVAIPSRIDKTPHRRSVIPVLVERYGFRAFDLAYADSKDLFKAQWPKLSFHLFSFSNASALAQVGSRSAKVRMTESGFAGIRELVARQCA